MSPRVSVLSFAPPILAPCHQLAPLNHPSHPIMTDLGSLERYRDVVDDWEAFREAALAPLPTVVWANTLRIDADELRELLEHFGWGPRPLAWYPGAFRLRPGARPGARFGHRAGLYQVQEEVSLLPPLLLDPRPGERVLDTCAAPGGKTAQIAVRMRDTGTVVANDRDQGRIRSLRAMVERLGLTSVVLTAADAANLPRRGGPYDRVLCDVPCSGEGTSRKSRSALHRSPRMNDVVRSQRAILRKAVALCRPRGRIVYSTCTYAPEENEGVVDAILAEGGVHVVPAVVPGLRSMPGLSEWEGQAFDPSLQSALRIYPHHNDTGGFFVCVLEREETGATPPSATSGEAEAHPKLVHRSAALETLKERFGLPEALFDGRSLIRGNRTTLSLVREGLMPPPSPESVALGLPFARADMVHPKPTTAGAMWLAVHATRNVIDIDDAQADAYFRRRPISLPASVRASLERGFVLLRCRGHGIGAAFYPGRDAPLDSQYPKAWALGPDASAFRGD